MNAEALKRAGVEIPEGMDAGEVVRLVTDLLRAVAEAKIVGHFELVRKDLSLGSEGIWNLRLKGHRQ